MSEAGVLLKMACVVLSENWVLVMFSPAMPSASRPTPLRRKLAPLMAGFAPSTSRRPSTLSLTWKYCSCGLVARRYRAGSPRSPACLMRMSANDTPPKPTTDFSTRTPSQSPAFATAGAAKDRPSTESSLSLVRMTPLCVTRRSRTTSCEPALNLTTTPSSSVRSAADSGAPCSARVAASTAPAHTGRARWVRIGEDSERAEEERVVMFNGPFGERLRRPGIGPRSVRNQPRKPAACSVR